MFYSHEILSDRKSGVAVVWLVATLGSKSHLKKVTRKTILDVDLSKACEVITDPEAPLALRLQGSLLYGASRVFSQQCGYVLSDTQNLRDKMRTAIFSMRKLQNDHDRDQMRSEQLNLPDDPAFNIELDLGFDLSLFDVGNESRQSSNLMETPPLNLGRTVVPDDGLDLHDAGLSAVLTPDKKVFDVQLGHAIPSGSARATSASGARTSSIGGPAVYDDQIFDIDDAGEMIWADERETNSVLLSVVTPELGTTGLTAIDNYGNDAVIGADDIAQEVEVIAGHASNGQISAHEWRTDNVAHNTTASGPNAQPESSPAFLPPEPSTVVEHGETVTTTEAPQTRVRTVRPQLDTIMEVGNRDLAYWDSHYLETMRSRWLEKMTRISMPQAKKNATFWIVHQGIGGVEVNFGEDREPHPLSVFSGETLLEALTGKKSSQDIRKRSRSQSDNEEDIESARRVRVRSAEQDENATHSAGNVDPGEDLLMIVDDNNIESQVGRQAPSSLKEHSSQMPWNISSRHGRKPVSSYGVSSSAGLLPGALFGPPSVTSGRRSRLTSASPLIGKGHSLSRLGSVNSEEDDAVVALDEDDLNDHNLRLHSVLVDDFELYGPAASVDTQTAADSQWLASTLEREAHNFLDFLTNQIEIQVQLADEDDQNIQTITFEALLPPASNSEVVAAQAIFHVLALATKGLITIKQEEDFGDIVLGITGP